MAVNIRKKINNGFNKINHSDETTGWSAITFLIRNLFVGVETSNLPLKAKQFLKISPVALPWN